MKVYIIILIVNFLINKLTDHAKLQARLFKDHLKINVQKTMGTLDDELVYFAQLIPIKLSVLRSGSRIKPNMVGHNC